MRCIDINIRIIDDTGTVTFLLIDLNEDVQVSNNVKCFLKSQFLLIGAMRSSSSRWHYITNFLR